MADFTGLTGVWPAAIGVMSDASLSALRVIPLPQNGGVWTAGYLLSGQSATGSGNVMDARAWGRGVIYMRVSGNSASATVLASHDDASNIWVAVASYYTGQYTANCDNLIAMEQPYPYLRARVDFVSASGGISAAVWIMAHRVM